MSDDSVGVVVVGVCVCLWLLCVVLRRFMLPSRETINKSFILTLVRTQSTMINDGSWEYFV